MPTIDPSILRALSLSTSTSSNNIKIASHGGSGFSSTFRLTTPNTSIFIKTAPGSASATMFAGEHASLNAIHSVVPSLCPKSFAWGKLDNKDAYFLATEFLDLSSSRISTSKATSKGSGMTLAQKLAKLHTTPAPIPDGYSEPQFGFPVTTCCGDTPQPNDYTSDWAEFFAQNRLLAILEQGERSNGPDAELRTLIEKVVGKVVPKLLGKGHLGGDEGIVPVVVHGDLWSGNKGKGRFVGRQSEEGESADTTDTTDTTKPTEPIIFDPSSCYAHNEYELGMMRMFGGFDSTSFLREYHTLVPKTHPTKEYDDRICLYESYHHLNHWAIFGGGYRSGAVRLLAPLVRKYA